jgi:hypothetical protein
MEGGAHVVIEAVRQRHAGAGLAHRRQRGLLGADYPAVRARRRRRAGDLLLQRCARRPAMLPALHAAANARGARRSFRPEAERAASLLPPSCWPTAAAPIGLTLETDR